MLKIAHRLNARVLVPCNRKMIHAAAAPLCSRDDFIFRASTQRILGRLSICFSISNEN